MMKGVANAFMGEDDQEVNHREVPAVDQDQASQRSE